MTTERTFDIVRHTSTGYTDYRDGLLNLFRKNTGIDLLSTLTKTDKVPLRPAGLTAGEYRHFDMRGVECTSLYISGDTGLLCIEVIYDRHGWDGQYVYKPNCMHNALQPGDHKVPDETIRKYVFAHVKWMVGLYTGTCWSPTEYVYYDGKLTKNSAYGSGHDFYVPIGETPSRLDINHYGLRYRSDPTQHPAFKHMGKWFTNNKLTKMQRVVVDAYRKRYDGYTMYNDWFQVEGELIVADTQAMRDLPVPEKVLDDVYSSKGPVWRIRMADVVKAEREIEKDVLAGSMGSENACGDLGAYLCNNGELDSRKMWQSKPSSTLEECKSAIKNWLEGEPVQADPLSEHTLFSALDYPELELHKKWGLSVMGEEIAVVRLDNTTGFQHRGRSGPRKIVICSCQSPNHIPPPVLELHRQTARLLQDKLNAGDPDITQCIDTEPDQL